MIEVGSLGPEGIVMTFCQRALTAFKRVNKIQLFAGLFFLAMSIMTLILILQVWVLPMNEEGASGLFVIRVYRSWRVLVTHIHLAFKYLFFFVVLGFFRAVAMISRDRYKDIRFFQELMDDDFKNKPSLELICKVIFIMGIVLFSIPFTDLIYRRWLNSLKGITLLTTLEQSITGDFFYMLLTSSVLIVEALIIYGILKGFVAIKNNTLSIKWCTALQLLPRSLIFLALFSSVGSAMFFSTPHEIFILLGNGFIMLGWASVIWVSTNFIYKVFEPSKFSESRTWKGLYKVTMVLSLISIIGSAFYSLISSFQYLEHSLSWFIRSFTSYMVQPLSLFIQLALIFLFNLGLSFLRNRVLPGEQAVYRADNINQRSIKGLKTFAYFYLFFLCMTFVIDLFVLCIMNLPINFNYIFSVLLNLGLRVPYGLLLLGGASFLEEFFPPPVFIQSDQSTSTIYIN